MSKFDEDAAITAFWMRPSTCELDDRHSWSEGAKWQYEQMKSELDEAVKAMNDAHESLRKSGDQDKELRDQIATLKAQLWVAKDAALRTYDGLAQRADKYDKLVAVLDKSPNNDYDTEIQIRGIIHGD